MNIKEFFTNWMGSDFESDARAQNICADIEKAVAKRITKLEEQLPKVALVVNKERADDSDEDCAIYFGECGNCGEGIMPNWEACPICKSELNLGDGK